MRRAAAGALGLAAAARPEARTGCHGRPRPAVACEMGLPPWGAQKGRGEEAYVEYLKSINYISQALLEEAVAAASAASAAKDGSDVMPDTPKMLKVAEQCLERAKSSIAKMGKAKAKPVAEKALGPAPVTRHRRVFSDEGGKLSPFLPPEMFQKLQISEVQSSKKELTPLEEASLQNQKLKAAYEARMARLNPNQAMQKTSLTLSLQRQMMENLVIAKAREETLQRKMEERRLRLQEAANRRFSSNAVLTTEEQEQRAIYAAILEYEQDHEWPRLWKAQLKRSPDDLSLVPKLVSHLLSFADHPICQLLQKLQCTVYGRVYPLVSRRAADGRAPPGKVSRGLSLSSSLDAEAFLGPAPEGRRLRSSQSLHSMFSVQENNQLNLQHSLSSTPLIEDQGLGPPGTGRRAPPSEEPTPPLADRESSFEDLERFLAASDGWPLGAPREPQGPAGKPPTSQQEHLKAVVKDIHNSIDRLLSLTLLAFEGLNTAASKDQCVARLEEAFFAPLWAPLLAVYRNVYKTREAALSRSMELYRNLPPSEMGISPKLLPQGSLPRGIGSYPYCTAVQELMLLPLGSCPQKKLECIVRALRVICECAEDYCGGREGRPQPAAAAIGADDLLPILSYVVLKSNLPQLLPECAALEEFIHEGYLIGEEGYCLTSLQSALSYVESLHKPALAK
ncbi:VPS9 domain-containing protein 1 isoform X2 [Hemicordylus capensis]|uniref:VPS9 domain-containing protein 1 isoform X2 n=1 Tax=Hemicordylus capensis TaxID=884348 RepID=UPI00230478C7|nr:VPS9 domain-containing protein 1 isoform X2 [Hemicordylus capensis]